MHFLFSTTSSKTAGRRAKKDTNSDLGSNIQCIKGTFDI